MYYVGCQHDGDCIDSETCTIDERGQASCRDPCEFSGAACGRNALCTSTGHQARCTCAPGFFGDPSKECHSGECITNEECPSDRICNNRACIPLCHDISECGENALCFAENHEKICHCSPGYTGEPATGCRLLDFCKNAPCAPGARCELGAGSFRCLCADGAVGDPYNDGCRAAVECEHDDDCPEAAMCRRDGPEPKCTGKCHNNS